MNSSSSSSSSSSSAGFTPAAEPPDGVTADLEHPQDVGRTANIVCGFVCLSVVNALFILHAYVKLGLRRSPVLLEDWFCLASWTLVDVFLTFDLVAGDNGLGRNVWEVSTETFRTFLKLVYITAFLYGPAAFCTKVTLLLLIARVFSVNKAISKGIRIFICLLLLAYVPLSCLKAFSCRPISAYWESGNAAGIMSGNPNCLDQSRFFLCDIIVAVMTDFVILLLPVPLAWSVAAPRRQKVKIVFLLGAGGVATATTMLRAHYIVKMTDSKNLTKDFGPVFMTTSLELAIGLSCACLPSANILFEKLTSSLTCNDPNGYSPEGHLAEGADRKASSTVSTYWSSIMYKISTTTARTVPLTRTGDRDIKMFRRGRENGEDVESGSGFGPVVFNNRLDVPSIRSRSEERASRSSRDEDHRGLSDSAFEDQIVDQDDTPRRGGGGDAWPSRRASGDGVAQPSREDMAPTTPGSRSI